MTAQPGTSVERSEVAGDRVRVLRICSQTLTQQASAHSCLGERDSRWRSVSSDGDRPRRARVRAELALLLLELADQPNVSWCRTESFVARSTFHGVRRTSPRSGHHLCPLA